MKDKYFGAHEFQAREENNKSSSDRSFGFIFAGLFALLGTVSLYHGGTGWYYCFPLAASFGVFAMLHRACSRHSIVSGRNSATYFTWLQAPSYLVSCSTSVLVQSAS
jgi:hypothetical protein